MKDDLTPQISDFKQTVIQEFKTSRTQHEFKDLSQSIEMCFVAASIEAFHHTLIWVHVKLKIKAQI